MSDMCDCMGPTSGPPSVVDTDGETKLSFVNYSARVQTRAFWGAEEGQGRLPLKNQEFAWRRWERDRVCVHSAVGGLLLRQRARCLGCGGEEGREGDRTQALRAGLGQVTTGWEVQGTVRVPGRKSFQTGPCWRSLWTSGGQGLSGSVSWDPRPAFYKPWHPPGAWKQTRLSWDSEFCEWCPLAPAPGSGHSQRG